MSLHQFPKQPVLRRRITYWCLALWPFVALLLFFVVLSIILNVHPSCEPNLNC